MTVPVLDLDRIVEVLDRNQVSYLLVGGVSAIAYGATRPTEDFDCLPETSAANLDRVGAALRELRARLRVEGLSDAEAAELPIVVDGSTLANMEISTWQTDAGAIDVLRDIPNRSGRHLGYDDLAERATSVELRGIMIRAASLDDVIASKEWADRPKDAEALPELRSLRDAREGQAPPLEG